MSQHSQRTKIGPSVASIVIGAVSVAATFVAIVYVQTAPGISGREVVASVLGIGAMVGLTIGTVGLYADRQVARDRIRRQVDRSQRAGERAIQERVTNTGTWRGDAVGQVLSVRYDRLGGGYHVQGWLGENWRIEAESRCTDMRSLIAALVELEATGELEPVDDEGTRGIRARLDLPRHDPDPVATQPLPAALRQISVPVLRTEAERVAAMQDGPTDFIPRVRL